MNSPFMISASKKACKLNIWHNLASSVVQKQPQGELTGTAWEQLLEIFVKSQLRRLVSNTLRIFIDFGFYRQKREKAGLLSIKNR